MIHGNIYHPPKIVQISIKLILSKICIKFKINLFERGIIRGMEILTMIRIMGEEMKMNKKNMFDFKLLRKTVLVACCLLLVACKQEQSQGENAKKSNLINSGYLSMYAAGVRTSIARVFVRNGLEVQKIKNWDIDEKNFYKLDFSIEGQDTYGDNPEYEVFNPEGGGEPFYMKNF